jgi:glycerol-3-phosphate dehydrogenase
LALNTTVAGVPSDPTQPADLLVIGGGINGTGIARDAAGRGLRVVLCEKDDLAQGTSSRSSRLIHGGLRYLEHGEFRLVREALRERETLLRIAPHLVRPMCFVLPHVAGMRPAWLLRLGLFLYDHLARRAALPASRTAWLDAIPEGAAVRPGHRRGFLYSDCRTDDARLVVHNAQDAHAHGARIFTRCELLDAQPRDGLWHARLRDTRSGSVRDQVARVLVNAAGPWVDTLALRVAVDPRKRRIRLIKGSHLVVPKFWSGEHGYLLQHSDRRVIFVVPYEEGYALVGTTDVAYEGAPEAVAISAEETRYLCEAVNRQMRCALTAADVRYAYSGVRALVDDEHDNPSAVTRDYVLDLAGAPPSSAGSAAGAAHPLLLTVLGGKITTYRHLAEQSLELLRPALPAMGPAWTAHASLPGGDLAGGSYEKALAAFLTEAGFLPADHARGLFARHGSAARRILAGRTQLAAMGRHFGAGLYECEVRHFMTHEWAQESEDVLWRRSKFGLRLAGESHDQLVQWMRGAAAAAPASVGRGAQGPLAPVGTV